MTWVRTGLDGSIVAGSVQLSEGDHIILRPSATGCAHELAPTLSDHGQHLSSCTVRDPCDG